MTSHPKRGPGRAPRNQAPAEGAASPPIVFAILVTVVAAIAGAALVLRSTPTEQPATAASPAAPSAVPTDLSLTDEEAIERFEELDQSRIRAFEQRRQDDLSTVFVEGSAELRDGRRTIRKLVKDQVLMRHVLYDVRGVQVLKNTSSLVQIEQRVAFDIEFVDESGKNVTTSGTPELLRVHWTMERRGNTWLLAGGRVVEARDLAKS